MNPVLQEILHNITSRLAALEQSAQSDKLLIDLIQEQRAEIDRLRAAQPEQEPDETETLKRCLFQMQEAAKALAQPDRECDLNKCRNRVREASDFAGLAGAPSYRR